jgi:hypothetical protein
VRLSGGTDSSPTAGDADIKKINLEFRGLGVYVHGVFFFGRQEECVRLGRGDGGPAVDLATKGGGRWFLRMRSGGRKNVYFCFGENANWIKALPKIYVYFCLPGRKDRS